MAALHILMISDVYFPRINGVSTSTATFREDLQALGHRVTLIAPAYPQATGEEDPDIIRVPSRYLPMDPEDRMMRWSALKRLENRLAGSGFELVHVQTPFIAHYFGRRIARRLAVPMVESYHTFFQEYLFHYLPWLPRACLRSAARRFSRGQCNEVDRVIVPSIAMRDVLQGYGVATPIDIVPTGLTPAAFTPGDGSRFRTAMGIPLDRPLLVHVGRVAHEKNIGFLLEVVDRLRHRIDDVLLLIAGEGPARASLARQVERLQLEANVRFTGYLDRHAGLKDCYCAGDVFVFASRTETQGLVLIESMAQGTPVVSTAVMGTRDIVGPQRGAIEVREQADEFAGTLERLLSDPDRRARMADEARAFAREWSARAMAETMLGTYQAAGGQGRQPGTAEVVEQV
ncbi:MAG: glycosyltransferase [Halofilum sp. (in: g-proteobacteria)]|nr:glycosyltransferase [Halofilum sp. (in: g-proteobacteria)]